MLSGIDAEEGATVAPGQRLGQVERRVPLRRPASQIASRCAKPPRPLRRG